MTGSMKERDAGSGIVTPIYILKTSMKIVCALGALLVFVLVGTRCPDPVPVLDEYCPGNPMRAEFEKVMKEAKMRSDS